MKIRVTSEVDISEEELTRLFEKTLESMCEGASMWVREGRVWRDDPEWRHGSITEEQVKFDSKQKEKTMVEHLEWRKKRQKAARELRAILDQEPRSR